MIELTFDATRGNCCEPFHRLSLRRKNCAAAAFSVTANRLLSVTGGLVMADQLVALSVAADTSVQLVALAGQVSWTWPGAGAAMLSCGRPSGTSVQFKLNGPGDEERERGAERDT